MCNWNRHQRISRQFLYDHRIELKGDQFYTLSRDPYHTIKWYGIDRGNTILLKESIFEDIKANELFTAFVVARASISGGVTDYYWAMVCLINGPDKGKMTWADSYHYVCDHHKSIDVSKLSCNINFATNQDFKKSVLGVDHKIYISFPTKDQAMLFKLMYY